jgi:hypothetical protein
VSRSECMDVGIVVERRALDNPWQSESWHAIGVVPASLDFAPWSVLAQGDGWTHYHGGKAGLELFPRETETYKYNLESEQPAVYVMLRRAEAGKLPYQLYGATVCPGEAQAHHDTGDDIIDAVPMPAEVAAWLAKFVIEHHQEPEPRFKRKRDRQDPESLAARSRVRGGGRGD